MGKAIQKSKFDLELELGDEMSYERCFTRQDILNFAEISQDKGEQHMRLEKPVLQGLLIATLPTKLGGDIDFIAISFECSFLKYAYADENLICTVRVESKLKQSKRIKCSYSFRCVNASGELITKGTFKGFVYFE